MKKLIFLLFALLVPSLVFGTNFDDEWGIYVFGDAKYYKLVYDAIAMIVGDTTFMEPFFQATFAVSSLLAAKNWYSEDLAGGLWNVVVGLGIVTMLMIPTATVHILDVRALNGYIIPVDTNSTTITENKSYYKVDDIPLYLAVIPSLASSLKWHIINESTDALTPIAGGSLRDSGFATPMTLVESMVNTANFKYSSDSNYTTSKFGQALEHYIEVCLIKEVLYYDKGAVFGILDPKGDQFDALKPTNFANLSTTAVNDLNGNATTCGAFWDTNIGGEAITVKDKLTGDLKLKYPGVNLSGMADSMAAIAGIEAAAGAGLNKIANARMNIATTGALRNAMGKAGIGLTGIEASNAIVQQQTLFDGMTDNTGQFKWMIKVIPIIEYIIFAILIFLGLPMGIVAGVSGARKGGAMLVAYASGIVAFNFIDVGLAIVQSISLYFYQDKMASAMVMLGGSLNVTTMPLYMQEMAYMSGMMGLAAVITVPLVVGVVFKGETMAASAAFSAVSNKYQGDKGGTSAEHSLQRSAVVHEAEAIAYEQHAARVLRDDYNGEVAPKGALASEYLSQLSSQAEQLGGAMGEARVASSYGSQGDYLASRVESGMGTGMQKVTASIASGTGLLESINQDPDALSNFAHQTKTDSRAGFEATAYKGSLAQEDGSLVSRDAQLEAAKGNAELALRKDVASGLGASAAFKDGAGADFMHQTQTDSEAGIQATAAKGKFSKDNEEYNRETQVDAAKVMATDSLVKSVEAAKGLVSSMAFNSDGTKGKESEFSEYAKGQEVMSRKQANQAMGMGQWAETKSEEQMQAAMTDIKRVAAMGMASEVAKGRGFKNSKYGGDIEKFESDSENIERSKSDSMFGQAKGVRANKKAGVDYADNAQYGEESSQQSTTAKLKAQDGVAGAVKIDVGDATIKAKVQEDSLDKTLKAAGAKDGLASSNVESAMDMIAGTAGTQAAGKLVSSMADIAESDKQYADKGGFLGLQKDSATLKAQQSAGETKGLMDIPESHRANYIEGMQNKAGQESSERLRQVNEGLQNAGLVDSNNNPTPENWVAGMSFLKANNMNSSNAAVVGGMAFSGALGENSTVQGTSLNSLATGDTETNYKDHKTKKTGHGTQDDSGYNISASGLVQKALEETGIAEGDAAEFVAELVKDGGIVMAADQVLTKGKGRKAAIDGVAKIYHKARGHEKGLDSNGKTVWQSPEEFKKAGGVKNDDGIWEHQSNQKLDKSSGADLNQETTKTKANKATGVDSNAKTGIDISDSSSNSDSKSIPNSKDSSKSIIQQIEEQGKYEKTRARMESDYAKQNALNNGGTPEMLERQKMSLDALDDAHNQSMGNSPAPSSKGFFGSKMDALSDVWDGGGSLKSKFAMSAAALGLGAVSSQAANLMQAADPTSFITGTDMADGTIEGAMKNGTFIPPHAQQAFTAQPMQNTTQAIAADNVANAQMSSANNLQTIASLSEARSGGFMMQDAFGQMASFTTGKGEGNNLMMNGQDTGMPYQQFSQMMQDPNMGATFSNALSSSDLSNKDVYNTTNSILQDMRMDSEMATKRQRIANNAGDITSKMQHKEMLKEMSGESEDEEY
ncbi:MAG: hypothetical protein Q9M43_16095 [Sulfurimonas sp.]|nr:hypothetical protein [Sulfurimonas sp.]